MSSDRAVADFELTAADKASGLWLRLSAHLQARIDVARLRNDDPGASEWQTANLRGEIRALKALLRLGEDRHVYTGED